MPLDERTDHGQVVPMAFVWSRLALAAILAVGGATAAAAGPASPAGCDEAPRLACASVCPSACTIIADRLGDDDGADDPLIAVAPVAVEPPPRAAWDVLPVAPPAAPILAGDVLALAPKTSPPRT